ncbi:RNA deprotection pyrophosphohydrolase [Listeria kieliensis]|uniref:DNA mismatch repair protein MutT n=1 Tax=Listeria kieliensis TaxID=1621700 RepID=A0A3D8TVM6_9LIST|nr:nucleoside triphosphatase YtkD [Listeria kieliensis]RDX03063.1 DNA mismatch repair protein MutT [Listeria kieliensis]
MFVYQDAYGNDVKIHFVQSEEEQKDVLVIPHYKGKWLFTEHKIRGLEFPGGKGEAREDNFATAKRELMEETGAIPGEFLFVADYEVLAPDRPFTKRVFFCEIKQIELKNDYLETAGPRLIKGHLREIVQEEGFSFFMRDAGMQEILRRLDDLLGKNGDFLL